MAFDYLIDAGIRSHSTSLKNTSYDEEKNQYMTESPINVIHFDRVKETYLQDNGFETNMANSADALCSDGDRTYLIEFKNGENIDPRQVENKLKDSVTILCDLYGKTATDTRKDITFVLVYNENQRHFDGQEKAAIARANQSGGRHRHFGLDKANVYVKKALIYSKRDFHAKLLPRIKAV